MAWCRFTQVLTKSSYMVNLSIQSPILLFLLSPLFFVSFLGGWGQGGGRVGRGCRGVGRGMMSRGRKVTPSVLPPSHTHSPVPFCPRHPPSQTPKLLRNFPTTKLSNFLPRVATFLSFPRALSSLHASASMVKTWQIWDKGWPDILSQESFLHFGKKPEKGKRRLLHITTLTSVEKKNWKIVSFMVLICCRYQGCFCGKVC